MKTIRYYSSHIHQLKINAISAISNITLLLLLVPWFEATRAAFTRFAMQVISLSLTIYALQKDVKPRLDKEALWKSATASIATIPFLLLMEHSMTTIPTFLLLTIEIVGAGCIYLSSLYILKALHKKDFELLKQTFPKLAKYTTIPEKILLR